MFEFVEEALDAVAAPVKGLVAGRFLAAGAHRRDDRFDPVGGQALADAVGIVAFVEGGELQDVVRVEAFVEGFKLPAIVGLAKGQVKRDGAVFVEGRSVDLGGEASTRAPQSQLRPVFLARPPRADAPAPWSNPRANRELRRKARRADFSTKAARLRVPPSAGSACKRHASIQTRAVNPATDCPCG